MEKVEYEVEIWLWPARARGKNLDQYLKKMEENQKQLTNLINHLPTIQKHFMVLLVPFRVDSQINAPAVQIVSKTRKYKFWDILLIKLRFNGQLDNTFINQLNQLINNNEIDKTFLLLQAWQEKEIKRQEILMQGGDSNE